MDKEDVARALNLFDEIERQNPPDPNLIDQLQHILWKTESDDYDAELCGRFINLAGRPRLGPQTYEYLRQLTSFFMPHPDESFKRQIIEAKFQNIIDECDQAAQQLHLEIVMDDFIDYEKDLCVRTAQTYDGLLAKIQELCWERNAALRDIAFGILKDFHRDLWFDQMLVPRISNSSVPTIHTSFAYYNMNDTRRILDSGLFIPALRAWAPQDDSTTFPYYSGMFLWDTVLSGFPLAEELFFYLFLQRIVSSMSEPAAERVFLSYEMSCCALYQIVRQASQDDPIRIPLMQENHLISRNLGKMCHYLPERLLEINAMVNKMYRLP